jgi:hypothetical protein
MPVVLVAVLVAGFLSCQGAVALARGCGSSICAVAFEH